MTGIIYTYSSLEFGKKAIDRGFMDISNLNRFMNKVVFVPTEQERCLGEVELRKNGNIYCRIEITMRYLIEAAMKEQGIKGS